MVRRPLMRPSAARPDVPSVESFLASLARDERLAHVVDAPARPAAFAPLPPLPAPLAEALRADGRERLYRHQAEAIDHALAGRHVAIATETSSGKSLCFQLPVLAATMTDPKARALFLFPTNPLANDQEKSLGDLVARLPPEARPRGVVKLHGGLGSQKDAIARSEPQIVLTNPEMAHLYLLPQHRRWASFWAGLRYVVVDEIHLYRGAFGGHLAQLLRRIRRCAWRYGAKPQVIAASATVGNPRELAEELCAAPFELVENSTAPRGPRRTVLWQPAQDPDDPDAGAYLDDAVDLMQRALAARLQCILFARSRQLVEALATRLEERTGRTRVQLGVRAYRGGYTRDEREVIEQGLRAGTVRGVITTNALEVGIDIGSLDVCVIAGYPGSLMALRQQAGRVGRRDRPSAIVLVASENPLDHYLVQHPQLLTDAPAEKAVVGRLNPNVVRAHLACAAAEFPLWEAEIDRLGGDAGRRLADELVARGEARWGREGERRVLEVSGRPHNGVSLRSASQERRSIVDPDGERIGELDGAAAPRELHPGAIYLHQGRTFRVDRHEGATVHLVRAQAGHSTRVQGERTLTVSAATRRRDVPSGEARLVGVDVVDSYDRFLETAPRRKPVTRRIDPPVQLALRTEALVLTLSGPLLTTLSARGFDRDEALHGLEHLLTAFGATFVLCDREDLEGHAGEADGAPAVFLFDKQPGGMGFAATAFEKLEEILARAGEAVDACGCEAGCPACVHSGRCLRSNADVSKGGAKLLLRALRGLDLAGAPVASRPAKRPARKASTVAPVAPAEPVVRPRTPAKDAPWQDGFAPGDLVEHGIHGEGRVVEVKSNGRVVVDFGDGKGRGFSPSWLRKAR